MSRQKQQKNRQEPCCCDSSFIPIEISPSHLNQPAPLAEKLPFAVGTLRAGDRIIPQVSTTLTTTDKLGSWKARWKIGRMNYRIPPGLYAVGNPSSESPVLVSANYKMSFDRLRSELGFLDAWILVLDTKGINVWCAAGKGTFGTDEIVRMIDVSGLKEIVTHRKLILPQLGAPGVSAHDVAKRSGFKVRYGPVRASDIRNFLENGMKATPEMRRVRFGFVDRIVLTPTELIGAFKYALPAAVILFALSGLGPGFYSFNRMMTYGLTSVILLLGSVFSGALLAPAFLPWLPAKSFSGKGALIGAAILLLAGWHYFNTPGDFRNWIDVAAWIGIVPATTSFLAMNFTGSSTYTSLSGVLKEMRIAIPLQIGATGIGLVLWIVARFV